MNRWKILVITAFVVLLTASANSLFGAAQQPNGAPALSGSVNPAGQVAHAPKIPVIFGIHPAAILVASMLAGTVLILVTGTGRETLNSIDFERAYREAHKSSSAALRN